MRAADPGSASPRTDRRWTGKRWTDTLRGGRSPARPVPPALGVAAGLAWPVLAHAALWWDHDAGAVLAVSCLLPAAMGAVLLARGRRGWGLGLLGGALGLGLAAWAWPAAGPVLLAGLPHIAANLTLAALFAASLRPGREALVTGVARRLRGGTLPPELLGYTRAVTAAWCLFFLAQLAASALLLAFAPRPAWVLFVSALSLPLVAAMACGEYAVRRLVHRGRPHVPLRAMIGAFRPGIAGTGPAGLGASPPAAKPPASA